jgi:hypothetical protein
MREYFQSPLAGVSPELAGLPEAEGLAEEGFRLALKNLSADRFSSVLPTGEAAGSDELKIILTERTFGTEELSSYSACLEALEDKPFAGVARTEAEALDIRNGDRVVIHTETGAVELVVNVFDHMAAGVLVVPRLRRLNWQALGKGIRRQDIRKA